MSRFVAFLMVFLVVFAGQPSSAQSWTVGPVTPTWSDSTLWTPPIPIDDPLPADAHEPPVSASDGGLYNRELWVDTNPANNGRSQVGTADQAKFRTECRATFIKRADPQLYPGQYPVGHGHTFFGPMDPFVIANVEDFDYAMGRAHPASACQGGPLNGTLYWEPSIHDDRYGVRLTVMPQLATFYYAVNAVDSDGLTHLRRNFRFIGGVDPANFNDTEKRAELDGLGLRYAGKTTVPAGFLGISCYPSALGTDVAATVIEEHRIASTSPTAARYFKGPDNADPWGGACTEGYILIYVVAPDCWDGVNLSSPNGRGHVRYSASDVSSGKSGQCPLNYVKVPHFETKVHVDHDGWTEDLQHWYFSSDRMNAPDAPADPSSHDPCRKIGPWFCNGATAHFDWWGAWDNVTLEQWEVNCVGLVIDGVGADYADCNDGALADNRKLLDGGTPPEAGLSSNPINSSPTDRASDSTEGQRYFPVRPGDESQDALTLEVHPHG